MNSDEWLTATLASKPSGGDYRGKRMESYHAVAEGFVSITKQVIKHTLRHHVSTPNSLAPGEDALCTWLKGDTLLCPCASPNGACNTSRVHSSPVGALLGNARPNARSPKVKLERKLVCCVPRRSMYLTK